MLLIGLLFLQLIPALLMFTESFMVYKWYTSDGDVKADIVKILRMAGL